VKNKPKKLASNWAILNNKYTLCSSGYKNHIMSEKMFKILAIFYDNLTLSTAALGQLDQYFFKGKILQNLASVTKFQKSMYSAENNISLICYFG
jgi:hypothetical protein